MQPVNGASRLTFKARFVRHP